MAEWLAAGRLGHRLHGPDDFEAAVTLVTEEQVARTVSLRA